MLGDSVFFLYLFVLASLVNGQENVDTENSVDKCLHKGCELTPGLSKSEVNYTIKQLLTVNESHFEDNMLRILTWNLNLTTTNIPLEEWTEKKKDFCNYIIDIQPSVMSLQHVEETYLEDIEDCLKNYYQVIPGESTNIQDSKLFNPTFVKTWRKLRVAEEGTFSVSKTAENSKLDDADSPILCNWVKFHFAERRSWRLSNNLSGFSPKRSFAQRILRLLKKYITKFQHEVKDLMAAKPFVRPRTKYRWLTFYVAVVKLKAFNNETLATQQVQRLTSHLRNKVLKRKRYPIIFMGNFGFEDNSEPYKVLESKPWIHNAMLKAESKHPALSLLATPLDDREGLIDHIWENNFKTKLASTLLYDKPPVQRSRPIFSAMFADL